LSRRPLLVPREFTENCVGLSFRQKIHVHPIRGRRMLPVRLSVHLTILFTHFLATEMWHQPEALPTYVKHEIQFANSHYIQQKRAKN
jgi:hypothetical protein